MRRIGLLGAAALLAATALVACGSDDDGGQVGGGVKAIFELPGTSTSTDFYALPFPNDLRLKADGTIDLSGHPNDSNQLLEEWLQLFASKTHGFGTNSAIFFRFSGPLDPTSLPADAAASLADKASVYLVNVDPASPERGKKVPIKLRFQEGVGRTIGANWLSVLPFPGFPLRPKTKYAVVVTDRVKDKDGLAIACNATFDMVRSGAAAQAVYKPLLDYLAEAGGDAATDVASATVFTTQDPVSLMGKIHDTIRRPCGEGQTFPACVPEPVAREVSRTATGATYNTFEGTYDTPLFQGGELPYRDDGGEIIVDGAGNPVPQQLQALKFALTVPPGKVPDGGWPIVLYAHGTGGDYKSFVRDGTADRLAAEGLAVISITQVMHKTRVPDNSPPPELLFFNFYNPVAARDNVLQGGVDDFQLLRLVEKLSVTDDARTHTFNGEKIMFMGHSQGGLSGPPFLAFEPKVKGGILSGAGGLVYIALLYKTSPASPSIPGLVGLFIRDEPLDEFNNVLALLQMFIEPSDPMNYARLLTTEPPPGSAPKDIFQSEGFTDTYAPIKGIEAFGIAMGLSPVGPVIQDVPGFVLRGKPLLTAPVTKNAGDHTAVFMQYTAPTGQDGHFVLRDVPAARKQYARFLGTLSRTGTATLEAP